MWLDADQQQLPWRHSRRRSSCSSCCCCGRTRRARRMRSPRCRNPWGRRRRWSVSRTAMKDDYQSLYHLLCILFRSSVRTRRSSQSSVIFFFPFALCTITSLVMNFGQFWLFVMIWAWTDHIKLVPATSCYQLLSKWVENGWSLNVNARTSLSHQHSDQIDKWKMWKVKWLMPTVGELIQASPLTVTQ